MGGENYVTDDDMLTRMSKCDNKVQDQYIIVIMMMSVVISYDHGNCNYRDDHYYCDYSDPQDRVGPRLVHYCHDYDVCDDDDCDYPDDHYRGFRHPRWNQVQAQYITHPLIFGTIMMPVIFTSDHHDDCDYFDDYHRVIPG